VAVSTKGKSPAMAGVIRRRIEKMITMKDIRSIELQSYARNIAKNHIPSPNERRKVLLQIIENNKINTFLENDQVSEAKDLVKKIIVQAGKSN
jgi:siroheme synthase (precorrin-2 oxidase/ferrochelatase)